MYYTSHQVTRRLKARWKQKASEGKGCPTCHGQPLLVVLGPAQHPFVSCPDCGALLIVVEDRPTIVTR